MSCELTWNVHLLLLPEKVAQLNWAHFVVIRRVAPEQFVKLGKSEMNRRNFHSNRELLEVHEISAHRRNCLPEQTIVERQELDFIQLGVLVEIGFVKPLLQLLFVHLQVERFD